MAHTYSQIYVQIVFAVQGRRNLLPGEKKEQLHRYITGIIRNEKQHVFRINSVQDHVHLLLSISPDTSISDFVRDIKANSSRFINRSGWIRGRFSWQEGFGAFSYSRSELGQVIGYIDRQEEHHRKQNFRDEYIELLHKFDVNFNPSFLFEWGE